MKPSISKEQAVAPDKPFRLQNQFALNTQEWIDPLGESGYRLRKSMESQGMFRPASSWQTHHLIPQAVWKENKIFFNSFGMKGKGLGRDS